MSRKLNCFFLTLLVLNFTFMASQAFGWPFGDKKADSSTKSAVAVQSSKANQAPVQSSASNEEEVPEEPGEEAPLVPELPQIPKIPTGNPVKGIPTKIAGTEGVSANLGQDPEIVKIKSQIQDIIKINESLKSNYSEQAAEIQKISEQARIHQRILKDLETAKAQQKAARAGSENFMNDEKIRLIQKETEKNQKFLDTLQSQDVSKNVRPIPMQEQQETRKS